MDSEKILIFRLDDLLYGLSIDAVIRVVRMVAVTPLPQAPDIVIGAINVGGDVIPVMNVRRRFGLRERAAQLDDHLLIARTARRTVALMVDAVHLVVTRDDAITIRPNAVCPGLNYLQGVMTLDSGLILIYDLDSFLSLGEEEQLDKAMVHR